MRQSSHMSRLGFLCPMVVCAMLIGPVAANETAICEAPAASAKLVLDGTLHALILTISNSGAKELSLEKFYFGENMLGLRAVKSEGNLELKQAIPLLGPGVEPVTIPPGKSFVHKVNLENSFADLSDALTTSDVLVSWALTMDDKSACFVQKLSGTFNIPKGR